ncbi:MAG: hypothetical protein FXF54_13620 [Kosmotoga sp.]|nr:MAG: hypothetical protein FXF54_13620 [Kosmotoga sp.]
MKFAYGTTNKGKIESMKRMLEGLNIKLLPLDEKFKRFEILEEGNSPLENARIKATEYYKILKKPVFSCDSGLYIDGLQEDRQPGLNIRRVDGNELTDEEMLDYYSNLVDELGGKVLARYKNAIYLIVDEEHHYYHDKEDISVYFFLVNKPHHKTVTGFPLNSLTVDIKSGKYYFDLSEKEKIKNNGIRKGFREFFKTVLAKQAQISSLNSQ